MSLRGLQTFSRMIRVRHNPPPKSVLPVIRYMNSYDLITWFWSTGEAFIRCGAAVLQM